MKNGFYYVLKMAPKFFQVVLNVSLIVLAIILCSLLVKELFVFLQVLLTDGTNDYKVFVSGILVFFLYFEFIAMIVKYFKENYHFPLRYFMYIGITAMVRLIIVDYDRPLDTLIYALVVLVLVIANFIMHMTPRERPDASRLPKKETKE
ncbi:phosphate-starvation-inducible protein PsiE [Paraliobacillus sediminis]|uniref:phosphate-starvation-inducible protein PsiE n=1 Tax=Paraliobacillus sediminis TaxID=1885916 RepID=UPI003B834234